MFDDPERFVATTVSEAASELFFTDLLAVDTECLFAFGTGLVFLSEVVFGEAAADEPLKSLLKVPRSWPPAHVTHPAKIIVAMSQNFLFTAGMLTTT